jgi:pyruvyl transferase EpsI
VSRLRKYIYKDDVIFLHGGGNFGDLYPMEEINRQNIVKSFKNTIISFPQTVYFERKLSNYILKRAIKYYNSHKNIYIMCRDNLSLQFLKENLYNCYSFLMPDMVLYYGNISSAPYKKNGKVLFCLRNDIEKSFSMQARNNITSFLDKKYHIEYFDTDNLSGIEVLDKGNAVQNIFDSFQEYEFIVTDRYHGAIFSYITSTPCIIFGNSYKKIEEGYIWFENTNFMYFAHDEKDFYKYLDKLAGIDIFKFNPEIITYFKTLKNFIHKVISS